MPNYYEISATDDTLKLKGGQGSAAFTVRYVGERSVEARVQAVAVEGAEDAWLAVEAPATRNMEPNQTDTFTVNVKVPPGTPPGRYGLRLDAMSVDNTDEEYDQGPLVTFEVAETKAQEPGKGFPWWIVIVVALVLVLGVLVYAWLNQGDDGSAPTKAMQEMKGEQQQQQQAGEQAAVEEEAATEDRAEAQEQMQAQGRGAAEVGRVDFRRASAGRKVPMNGWLQSVKAIPKGGYCSDAVPVVLGEGRYRLPFSALSTASPGDTNRCNGVELSFQLKRPARAVSISFFGADTAYELRAFGSRGERLGTDTANSKPYDYSKASTVTVSSRGKPIERFEFGHQTALTLITNIQFRAAADSR